MAAIRPAWDRGEFATEDNNPTEEGFDELVQKFVRGDLVLVWVQSDERRLDAPTVRPLIDAPLPDGPALAWIEFEVISEQGERFPGHGFVLQLPDGSVVDGVLDGHSRWHSDSLLCHGACILRLDPLPDPPIQGEHVVAPSPADKALSFADPKVQIPTGRRSRLVVEVPAVIFEFAVLGPEGERVPLPAPNSAVFAEFADGSSVALESMPSNRFRLPVSRDIGPISLHYPCASGYLVVPPAGGATRLTGKEDAMVAFAEGANFLTVPLMLASSELDCVAQGVSLRDGRLEGLRPSNLPNDAVTIVFKPRWYCLQFDYYDRSATCHRTLGAVRGSVSLVIDGYDSATALSGGRKLRERVPSATAGWPVARGDRTVHCLAQFECRGSPNNDMVASFALPPSAYIDHRGESPIVRVLPEATAACFTEQWHLYDLPEAWSSRGYPAALGRWSAEAATQAVFLPVAKTSVHQPLVFSLDTVVLSRRGKRASDSVLAHLFDAPRPIVTLFSADCLEIHKLATSGPLRSKLSQPKSGLIYDVPPDLRLVLVGGKAFAVSGKRDSGGLTNGGGTSLGVRIAEELVEGHGKDGGLAVLRRGVVTSTGSGATSAAGTGTGPVTVKRLTNVDLIFLRCCGVVDGRELVTALAWGRTRFNYDPQNVDPVTPEDEEDQVTPLSAVPNVADRERWERECMVDARRRWERDGDFSIELGDPVTSVVKPRFFFQSAEEFSSSGVHDGAYPHYVVRVYEQCRAQMGRQRARWELSQIHGPSRTPAHEIGHSLGLPDEYIESQTGASLYMPGFRENAGSMYAVDQASIMTSGTRPRPRHLWYMGQIFRDFAQGDLDRQPFTVRKTPFHATFEPGDLASVARHPLYTARAGHRGAEGGCQCDVARFDLAHEPPAIDGPWRSDRGEVIDGLIKIKVNIAWAFDVPSMRFMTRAFGWVRTRADALERQVRARVSGTLDGQLRHMAAVLSVRHLLTTCPRTARGTWAERRARYLSRVRVADERAYDERVNRVLTHEPAHVAVSVARGLYNVTISIGPPRIEAVVSVVTPSELGAVLVRAVGAALGQSADGAMTYASLEPAIKTVFEAPDLTLERLR